MGQIFTEEQWHELHEAAASLDERRMTSGVPLINKAASRFQKALEAYTRGKMVPAAQHAGQALILLANVVSSSELDAPSESTALRDAGEALKRVRDVFEGESPDNTNPMVMAMRYLNAMSNTVRLMSSEGASKHMDQFAGEMYNFARYFHHAFEVPGPVYRKIKAVADWARRFDSMVAA
jgi:hypothetical protein